MISRLVRVSRRSTRFINFKSLRPLERLAVEDEADKIYGAGGSLAVTAAETMAEEEDPSEVHNHFVEGRILKVFAVWLAAHQRDLLTAIGTGMNEILPD
jgi:hypothetical protein